MKGDYERALADYESAIRNALNDTKIYLSRGLIFAKRGQHEVAISDFNQSSRFKNTPKNGILCVTKTRFIMTAKITLADYIGHGSGPCSVRRSALTGQIELIA